MIKVGLGVNRISVAVGVAIFPMDNLSEGGEWVGMGANGPVLANTIQVVNPNTSRAVIIARICNKDSLLPRRAGVGDSRVSVVCWLICCGNIRLPLKKMGQRMWFSFKQYSN